MPTFAFLDTEITAEHHIVDFGCITSDSRPYQGASVIECLNILRGCDFICGHNVIHLDYRDLYLDKFLGKDSMVDQFKSGDNIKVVNERLLDKVGQPLLQFYNKFTERLTEFHQQGYKITEDASTSFFIGEKQMQRLKHLLFYPR